MQRASVIHVQNRQVTVFQNCVESDFETTEALMEWAAATGGYYFRGLLQVCDSRLCVPTGKCGETRGETRQGIRRERDKDHNKRHSNANSETRRTTSPAVVKICHRKENTPYQMKISKPTEHARLQETRGIKNTFTGTKGTATGTDTLLTRAKGTLTIYKYMLVLNSISKA